MIHKYDFVINLAIQFEITNTCGIFYDTCSVSLICILFYKAHFEMVIAHKSNMIWLSSNNCDTCNIFHERGMLFNRKIDKIYLAVWEIAVGRVTIPGINDSLQGRRVKYTRMGYLGQKFIHRDLRN